MPILQPAKKSVTPRQRIVSLHKINSILNTNDIFIVSDDTNSDDKSIIKAYDHKNFQLSFLDSIAEFNQHFKDHTNSFEVMYEFIPSESTLYIYYKARKKLTFYYPLHGNIEIQEGQKLRGIKSKKFHHKEFQTLLESNGFKTLEIINNSDKIKLFICKKI